MVAAWMRSSNGVQIYTPAEASDMSALLRGPLTRWPAGWVTVRSGRWWPARLECIIAEGFQYGSPHSPDWYRTCFSRLPSQDACPLVRDNSGHLDDPYHANIDVFVIAEVA